MTVRRDPQGRTARPPRGHGGPGPHPPARRRNGMELPEGMLATRARVRLDGLPALPRSLRPRGERHPHARGLPRRHVRVPRRAAPPEGAVYVELIASPDHAHAVGLSDEEHFDGDRAGHRRRPRAPRHRGADHRHVPAQLRRRGRRGGRAARRDEPPPLRRRLQHGRRRGRLPARAVRARLRDRRRRRPGLHGARGRARGARVASAARWTCRASPGSRTASVRSRTRRSWRSSRSEGSSWRSARLERGARRLPVVRGAPTTCASCSGRPGHPRLRRPTVLRDLDRPRVRHRRCTHGLRRWGAGGHDPDGARCGVRRRRAQGGPPGSPVDCLDGKGRPFSPERDSAALGGAAVFRKGMSRSILAIGLAGLVLTAAACGGRRLLVGFGGRRQRLDDVDAGAGGQEDPRRPRHGHRRSERPLVQRPGQQGAQRRQVAARRRRSRHHLEFELRLRAEPLDARAAEVRPRDRRRLPHGRGGEHGGQEVPGHEVRDHRRRRRRR